MDDALDLIIDFAKNCKGGESYWTEMDDVSLHSADMGYAIEFLDDFQYYVNKLGGMENFAKLWNEYKKSKGIN